MWSSASRMVIRFIISPGRGLILAVGEANEVVGAVVSEAVGGHAQDCIGGVTTQGIISVGGDVADLVGVSGRPGDIGGIAPMLHPVVRIFVSKAVS
jgi:hypothetical protein